jgi:hypothetical protein
LVNFNYLLGDAATTRYSNSQFIAMNTTRGQTAIQANHQIFLHDEKFLWQGKLQFLNWPEYTYGLGARTPDTEPTKELVSSLSEFIARINPDQDPLRSASIKRCSKKLKESDT